MGLVLRMKMILFDLYQVVEEGWLGGWSARGGEIGMISRPVQAV